MKMENTLKTILKGMTPYRYSKTWAEYNFDKEYEREILTASKIILTSIDKKILTLDNYLIPLLEDSDSDFKEIKLPYNEFFINNDLHFKGTIIKGIGLCLDSKGIPIISYTYHDFKGYGEQWRFHGIKKEDLKYFKENIKISEFILNFLYNLINLINSEKEIEFVERKVSKIQNLKREIRGKQPKLADCYIRVEGTLKRYCQEYSESRTSMHVRFLIRGHWRSYSNKRFLNLKNKKIWIKPYYKGTGLDVSKKFVNVK